MGCEYSRSKNSHTFPFLLEKNAITIKNQSWNIEVAHTSEKKRTGLMFRKVLPKGEGMFFIFDRADFHTFWMKNTFIPLDVIWISEDKKVVDTQTLTPCQNQKCPLFSPSHPARFVLEINAGEFKGSVGDSVLFK